jgi:hypothetical protein
LEDLVIPKSLNALTNNRENKYQHSTIETTMPSWPEVYRIFILQLHIVVWAAIFSRKKVADHYEMLACASSTKHSAYMLHKG